MVFFIRRLPLGLLAALIAFSGLTAGAGKSRDSPLSRPVITAANADQLVELRLPPIDGITSAVWSPDSKSVFMGGQFGLWQTEAATPTQPLRRYPVAPDGIACLAMSPDGGLLAAGIREDVVLFDSGTGDVRRVFTTHGTSVRSVAFSPDGKTLAAGNYDGTVRLWNFLTGEPSGILESSALHSMERVAFNPDGTLLVATGYFGIAIWDVASGKAGPLLKIPSDQAKITEDYGGAAFSSNGKLLASAHETFGLQLWSIPGGDEQKILHGDTTEATTVAFSPDGKTLLSGHKNGEIQLWDMTTGRAFRILKGHTEKVKSAWFSPDGKSLISTGWDGTVRLWNVDTGKQTAIIANRSNAVTDFGFTPDGQSLIAAGGDWRLLRFWDTSSFTVQAEFNTFPANAFIISPNGKLLASRDIGNSSDVVRLFDLSTNKLLPLFLRHNSTPDSLGFSADSSSLYTIDGNNVLRAWTMSTGRGKPLALEKQPINPTTYMFIPDRGLLVGAEHFVDYQADKRWSVVRIWDLTTLKERTVFENYPGPVLALALSPDGTRLAVGGVDEIAIFDSVSGNLLFHIPDPQTGASWFSRSLAFNPDGSLIASGNGPGKVELWDAVTGRAIGKPLIHGDKLYRVAFSPDGTLLVTSDGLLHFYGIKQ